MTAALVATVLLASCSRGGPSTPSVPTVPVTEVDVPLPTDTSGSTIPFAPADTTPDGATDLRVHGCPDPIVIQTSGPPSLAQSALFRVAARDGGQITKGTYTAALIDARTNTPTGVRIEIRNGGADVNGRTVPQLLHEDTAIFAGQLSTDDAIAVVRQQPTVAVLALQEHSPLMIFWDAKAFPAVRAIPDLATLGAKVRYSANAPYMDYLSAVKVLAPEGVDPVLDFTPQAFLAAAPAAQEGSAIVDPPLYRNLPGFDGDITYQLVRDTGYDPYLDALVVRPEVTRERASCLSAFVPMLQAAQVAFTSSAAPTLALIRDVATAQGVAVPPAEALDSWTRLAIATGVIGNGNNATLGDMERARIAKMIGIANVVARARATTPVGNISADALFTNVFVSPQIGRPPP